MLRHRAHLPPVQADPGLDLPEDPHPRSRRPLDLADPLGLHPATSRPSAGGRPLQAVGEAGLALQAHPRTSPPRRSAPPPEGRLPSRSTEIHAAGPRTATRPQEQPAHRTLRRADRRQTRPRKATNEEINDPTPTPHRLKIKSGPVISGGPLAGTVLSGAVRGERHQVHREVVRASWGKSPGISRAAKPQADRGSWGFVHAGTRFCGPVSG